MKEELFEGFFSDGAEFWIGKVVDIEAQKTSIKKSSDLISVINRVTKNREKSLLLSIINNDNRKRYIGVKLN